MNSLDEFTVPEVFHRAKPSRTGNAGGRMDTILKYLLDAWRVQLGPMLAPVWDSAGLWRSLALGFVTIIVLGWRSRDRVRGWILQPVKRQRDRHVFRQANAILPEPELYALLGQLERGGTVKLDRITRLTAFLGAAGNRFFSGSAQHAVDAFLETTHELEQFVSQTFGPPDQTELRQLTRAVEVTYRAFRNSIRETLIV